MKRKVIVYLLCFFLSCMLQDRTLEKNAFDIEGTWVLYDGGCVAPEVLHFCRNASGTSYDLVDYCDEVWLNGNPLTFDMVKNPNAFTWEILEQKDTACDQYKYTLLIEYQNNYETIVYNLDYESQYEGLDFEGISLKSFNSGGGWIKITTIGFGE